MSNNKSSCENLPKGPSILKRGFSEILILIQRAYTLINANCTVPSTSKLCDIINLYLNKPEYKQTDDIIIILHEKLTLIAEYFIKRGITDISKGITFHDPYINSAVNQNKKSFSKKIYNILIMKKSLKDDNSTLKWDRAGYIFNINQIIRACQTIGSLKIQASIKSRNLRLATKAYIEPKVALKAGLIEDNFCKNCYNINSTIHYLLECPIAKYVWMILEYIISKVLTNTL